MLLKLYNYKINGKTTLNNPYKINIYPFPQVEFLVGQFNNNNTSNNSHNAHISNQAIHMNLKIHIYTCKGQRGNFTSYIHILLRKIENTCNKQLASY